MLRATTACTFSTSQLPKVIWTWCALYSLTWKRASRHNGMHFFDISTSKSGLNVVCFVRFGLEICFAPQRRAIFISHLTTWLGRPSCYATLLPVLLHFHTYVHATLLPVLFHFHTYVLTTLLPLLFHFHTYVHATLLPLLLHFHTYVHATLLPVLFLHTFMLSGCHFSSTSIHGSGSGSDVGKTQLATTWGGSRQLLLWRAKSEEKQWRPPSQKMGVQDWKKKNADAIRWNSPKMMVFVGWNNKSKTLTSTTSWNVGSINNPAGVGEHQNITNVPRDPLFFWGLGMNRNCWVDSQCCSGRCSRVTRRCRPVGGN